MPLALSHSFVVSQKHEIREEAGKEKHTGSTAPIGAVFFFFSLFSDEALPTRPKGRTMGLVGDASY